MKKNRYLILRIILITIILFFIYNCIKKNNKENINQFRIQGKPLWEGRKELAIKEILSIGDDDLDNQDYIFGDITDISIDEDDNIFVLDYRNYKASKFSSDGKFIKSYGYGYGQGPGESQFPVQICSDAYENVYICDADQRRINIFDKSNKLINSIRIEKNQMPLNDMLVYKGSILFVGVDVTFNVWKDGIFQMYSLPGGEYINSIGRSGWFMKNLGVICGANNISINKKKDYIIVSHSCPYEIEIFSKDFSLLKRFGRKLEYFENIITDKDNHKIAAGAALCMTCLADGKIVNVVRNLSRLSNNKYEIKRYFDFFDDNGNYLISIAEDRFGISGRYNLAIASDSHGDILLSYQNPYPLVRKFKIGFVDRK